MSDETTADETPAEETAEEQAAAEVEEAPAEKPTADEEPAAEAAEEPAAEEVPAAEAAEDGPADEAPAIPAGDPATARVFLTDTGYRVVSLWSEPEAVALREGRHGDMVDHQLYPVDALPEKVQRALNPLKASKKGA